MERKLLSIILIAAIIFLTLVTMNLTVYAATTPTPTTSAATNLALNKLVTYSSQQSGNEAIHINDGVTTNRWSASPYPQWIQIDLGSIKIINKIELLPYLSRAYQYKVESSTDGTNYTQIINRTGNTTGGTTLADTFTNSSARYVRLTVTGCYNYTGGWTSIAEFRVFAVGNSTPTPTPVYTPTPTPNVTPTPTPSITPSPSPTGEISYYGDWMNTGRANGVLDNTVYLRTIISQELGSAGVTDFRDIQTYIRGQIDKTAASLGSSSYPVRTRSDGSWITDDVDTWVAGHWTGMLWLAYRQTGDPKYLNWVQPRVLQIYSRRTDSYTHDHGFLFGLSHINGLEHQTDSSLRTQYRSGALTASQTYTTKQNPLNGFISWHGSYADNKSRTIDSSVIDSMMNIPLMWWATEQSGDSKYAQVGLKQAENIRTYAIRSDYSTAHGVEFNPQTGTIIGQKTYQGYSDSSCWSRGHAWAIHGFTVVYFKTGNKTYLNTARALADYYLNHLPTDLVPYWDFNYPGIPNTVRDTSAAAVVASALQNLARFEDDQTRAANYMRKSIAMLKSLSTSSYLTRGITSQKGVLLHGCQYYAKASSDASYKDACLIFGDYYYMEAIERLLNF